MTEGYKTMSEHLWIREGKVTKYAIFFYICSQRTIFLLTLEMMYPEASWIGSQ